MSTNCIKLAALICMVIDHIGEFIPQTPMWFHYIGRLSAPLFFYCSAWGFYYTRNRKKYLLRLYLMGNLMTMGNIFCYASMGMENVVSNNIFPTIFLGCMLVLVFENAENYRQCARNIGLFVLWQLLAFAGCAILAEFINIPKWIDMRMLYYAYGALFGSAVFTEGSVLFVFFFAAVYFLKQKPIKLSAFVVGFAAGLTLIIRRTFYMRGAVSYLIPFYKYQWLMVFVIPFFFLYNGKKGKGMKYFYYVFYPLHIWILYAMQCLKVG